MAFSKIKRIVARVIPVLVLVPMLIGCTAATLPTPTQAPAPTSMPATTEPTATLPVTTETTTATVVATTRTVKEANLTVVPVTVSPPQATPVTPTVAVTTTVSGKLLKLNGAAIISTTVYLARMYKNAANDKGVFALDVVRSPKALTKKDGAFSFTSVESGDYVLIIGTPGTQAKSIVYSKTPGSQVIFTITGDKPNDLGTLKADY